MSVLTTLVAALITALLLGGAATPPPATGTATREVPTRQGAWPLSPRPEVARGFAPPPSPWAAGHRGVDLRGRTGQPVRSALRGTVTFAAPLAGRGVVVVRSGSLRTTYEPVRAAVTPGQVVARGQRLGTLQHVAGHCLPATCLHWGLLRGKDYLNPLGLVGAGPVRLLPWSGEDPGPLR